MPVWNEVWILLTEARRFIYDHRARLAPWVFGILAANWVADVSNVASKIGEGARAFRPEPLTGLSVARAFGWAAGSAVQPGQGINPPWALVPEMTNPYLLLALANFLELALAVVSALLLHIYRERRETFAVW